MIKVFNSAIILYMHLTQDDPVKRQKYFKRDMRPFNNYIKKENCPNLIFDDQS